MSVNVNVRIWSLTDGINFMMLEQRPDHTIADHDGGDVERYEFQSSEPVSISSVTGTTVGWDRERTESLGGTALTE